jgi:hypothetical protein
MPVERRPLDQGLAALVGRSEEDAVAWWKARFEQIAAIPTPTARAGALVPEWRELAVLPEAQRLALTKARILAVEQLPAEQQQRIFEARSIGAQQAKEAATSDTAFIRDKVAPLLPQDLQRRVRETLDRA